MGAEHRIHFHVHPRGNGDLAKDIRFRDALREDTGLRDGYAHIKSAIAGPGGGPVDAVRYQAEKGIWILEVFDRLGIPRPVNVQGGPVGEAGAPIDSGVASPACQQESRMSANRVGIVVGSRSDIAAAEKAAAVLDELGVGNEIRVISAHRAPDLLGRWVDSADERGIGVIIAIAGLAAHLPGVVASQTTLPVIGVPMAGGISDGLDALLAIVQMPKGVPVATVGVGNGENAGLLAASILSLSDPALRAPGGAARDPGRGDRGRPGQRGALPHLIRPLTGAGSLRGLQRPLSLEWPDRRPVVHSPPDGRRALGAGDAGPRPAGCRSAPRPGSVDPPTKPPGPPAAVRP